MKSSGKLEIEKAEKISRLKNTSHVAGYHQEVVDKIVK
jgi:hypothetical protein